MKLRDIDEFTPKRLFPMVDTEEEPEAAALGKLASAAEALARASQAVSSAKASPPPVPEITVMMPEIRLPEWQMPSHAWQAEITDRDERGFIKRVRFTPLAEGE